MPRSSIENIEISSSNELYSQLYQLRRGKTGEHERPHKPALLLSLIDLVESGHFSNNAFRLDETWHQRFRHYFDIVAKHNDAPNSYLPFYYLKSDPFWHLVPSSGVNPNLPPQPKSRKQAYELYNHASVDLALWKELSTQSTRNELRQALVSRYFPDKAAELLATHQAFPSPERIAEEPAPYKRSAAFRTVVSEIYDHQCVACGLRIRIDNSITFVDAAHILPFSESRNDHPSNGLALCKNHHWAFDQRLIALDPDHNWQVSERLDPRRSPGEGQLNQLKGLKVLRLPSDSDFHPNPSALAWRTERLLRA